MLRGESPCLFRAFAKAVWALALWSVLEAAGVVLSRDSFLSD